MHLVKRIVTCLVTIAVWGITCVYLAFEGAWMAPVVPHGDTVAFFQWAVNEIESKNKGNAVLLLLENGEITNRHTGGTQTAINQDTLFPTASFSKWVTALAVMNLVEDKLLDLDSPVSRYLTRWQLPDSGFDNDQVTIRRLLSHTAGLTDRLGFGDYGVAELLPSVEEELRNPRASSGKKVKVAVGVEPGTEFLYSGGGYLILQLVIEEVSGATFIDYVQRKILKPLRMSRSSFENLSVLDNVSKSYNLDGTTAQTFQYASPAATGFASSVNDLAKLAKSMLPSSNVAVLTDQSIKSMREPHGFMMGSGIWGLGTILYAPTQAGDRIFGHDGANDPAINSTLRLNPETSDGIIVLVSGHPSLASNIGSEWVLWQTGYPDFLQTQRTLKSVVFPFIFGSFIVLILVFTWFRRTRNSRVL